MKRFVEAHLAVCWQPEGARKAEAEAAERRKRQKENFMVVVYIIL